ncbi:glycosyl hydrolase family 71-domain-containing protein, partial [Auriculariales sp. MPI-PUGE-AT-0066]
MIRSSLSSFSLSFLFLSAFFFFFMRLSSTLFSALAVSGTALAAPHAVAKRQVSEKLVAAHFMVGIVETYDQAAWEADMKIAASIGIDAFALNIGKDAYNDDQLGFAYAAAEATGFKVFISFDFAYWGGGDVAMIGDYLKKYGSMAGQLIYQDKVFVSSFVGDNMDWRGAEAASGLSIFACPNGQPGSFNNWDVDCGMSWNAAWPNEGNQPISANATIDLDKMYMDALKDRPYMAPISPWFFTHFGGDTYNKNWLFLSDTLYTTRWDQMLDLGVGAVEILTWNDYGEAHYIGPLHPEDEHVYAGGPTGAVKWTRGMPHDALRDVTAEYIKAFKAGEKKATASVDELVYYYRPNPKGASCTDPVAKPNGADFVADAVFVIAMATAPGKVVITSGGNAAVEIDVPAGITTVQAPMGVGKQSFAFTRDGATVMNGDSDLEITETCEVNNFNIFVGSVTGSGSAPAPPTSPTTSPDAPAQTETTTSTDAPAETPSTTTTTDAPAETPSTTTTSQESTPATTETSTPAPPSGATGRLVFSHFMIGIVSNRNSPADYDIDMKRAKEIGIDAFALNIGVDPYTDAQLELAYQSAENNDMKVFISFDFNWFKEDSEAARIGELVKKYGAKPAQLMIDGKAFVSSFAGDRLDVATVRSTAGIDLFMCPNFQKMDTDFGPLDCAFNWMGWNNDGDNKAPKDGKLVTVHDGDTAYLNKLAGKPYMAPVSPWFFTHFGSEVPYSKNWVFPGDDLWFNRWNEILAMGPNYIEITTWNDYGESHYIGPLSSTHTDDGGSKWVNDASHDGFLDMAIPYIKAYKAGATDVTPYIEEDKIVYWYRRTPRGVECDATDTTMGPADNSTHNYFNGKPDGWETMEDKVFVVALLKEPGTVTINSGGVEYVAEAGTGATLMKVDMGTGTQAFALSRGGSDVFSGVSLVPIVDECICGIYNFNPVAGSVPAAADIDYLNDISLQAFSKGLQASCAPSPTYGAGAQPPATAAPTSTVTVTDTVGPTAPPSGGSSSSAPASTPTDSTSAPTSTPTDSSSAPASTPTDSSSAPTSTPTDSSSVPASTPTSSTTSAPTTTPSDTPAPPSNATGRLVFSHFMIGIVSNRNSPADYDIDMKRAKEIGIDAFALNIGVDPYTDAQLELAYQSAENNDMKVFISFDFNWFKEDSEAARIGELVKKYGAKPAQLMIDGKAFVSSFAGDRLDVATVRSTAGIDLFMCPNFQKMDTDFGPLDCAFNWMGW